ncbi:MAG: ion channel [Pseudomonadota bacterium]
MEVIGTGLLFRQIVIGFLVVSATVVIQAEMLNLFSRRLGWLMTHMRRLPGRWSETGVIVITIHGLLFALILQVSLWAVVLFATGAVKGAEASLYFSLVCFTTLGFGDITLPVEWRFLSAIIGANGFLMFGWSTAYMVELIRRVH